MNQITTTIIQVVDALLIVASVGWICYNLGHMKGHKDGIEFAGALGRKGIREINTMWQNAFREQFFKKGDKSVNGSELSNYQRH